MAERVIQAADLFCGVGGLTHGLAQAGIVVRAGLDIDETCKYGFETNNGIPLILKDIAKTTGPEISDLFQKNKVRLLAGCAPCQPFSRYTQGRNTRKNEKWGMLYEFLRLIRSVSPELVTMENVPELTRHKVYSDFESALERLGYFVQSEIVYCPDYGIPQTRQRLVLLASKLGDISLIPKTHDENSYVSVRDTIQNLPRIAHGQQCKKDPLHKSSGLSEINLKRIKASRPGGSWLDWDKRLVAKCHKSRTGDTYRGVYGRMTWDDPSPTITTQFTGFGNGRFGHPTQNRALSLREGALLQTFPKRYKFVEDERNVLVTQVAKMIGNAVPVRLGRVIGKSIVRHVDAAHG